ncbi:MAG: N-acetyltransferase [Clostridiales bacterium]|nr:N-acetyltransferase [Clostridiales bacterium]
MIRIVEAKTKQELTKFFTFPNKLYKSNPYYVTDMIDSQVNDWLPGKNPAMEFCEGKCFLALTDEKVVPSCGRVEGGEIVGRIAAILNRRANEKFGKNYMIFSHIDFIDDAEVSAALLAAVEAYAKEKGCTAVHGPMGFSDMDREGMLIHGFDQLGQFYTYYNFPYYMDHMERFGYVKEVDWVEYAVKVPESVPENLKRIADRARERQKLHVVDLSDKKKVPQYIRDVFGLYNETYTVLFGMVPLTQAQIDKYVHEFLPLISNRSAAFVYNDKDELLAFGIGGPSLARANQKSKGRMLPIGWFHLLRALYGKNERWDMFLIAVRPELKGAGLNFVVLEYLCQQAIKAGVAVAETGPQLEENVNVLASWRMFEKEQHKRRRCWVKELS